MNRICHNILTYSNYYSNYLTYSQTEEYFAYEERYDACKTWSFRASFDKKQLSKNKLSQIFLKLNRTRIMDKKIKHGLTSYATKNYVKNYTGFR